MPNTIEPEKATGGEPAETFTDDKLFSMLYSEVDKSDDEKKAEEAAKPSEPAEHSRSLHESLDDTPVKPADAAQGDAKKPEEKKAEEKKEGQKQEEEFKPIRKRTKAAPRAPVEAAPVTPATTATTAEEVSRKAESDWEKGLLAEESDQLASARFAEKQFPDKYKGLGDKVKKFLKDHGELVAKPDFDPEDSSYRAWIEKNQPRLSQSEVRVIERARAVEEARNASSQEVNSKTSDIYDELHRRDAIPAIKNEGTQFFRRVAVDSIPDEVKQVINANGGSVEKAREVYKMEFDVAEQVIRAATDDVETFLQLAEVNPRTGRAIVTFDAKNPSHARAADIMNEACENFKRTASVKQLTRDGKQFVSRIDFVRMTRANPAMIDRVWTLDKNEIIAQAQQIAAGAVKKAITDRRSQMESYGFRRTPAAPQQPPAQQQQKEAPPPAIRPSPSTDTHGKADAGDLSPNLRSAFFGVRDDG